MVNDEINENEQFNTEPLRTANPLPESETDSNSESESESEVSSEQETEIQQPLAHHELAWQYTQQFGLHAFLWITTLWNILSRVAATTQTVSLGVIRSLQPHIYIFFKDSHYPYRMQDYSSSGPGVAPVEWYYNADTKEFISNTLYNTSTEYNTQHFDWLAGQIKYNNLVLYDITDFLEQIRWANHLSSSTRPSIGHVLAAWSLYSGKVLNSVEGLTLQTINADGTESTLPYRG